MEIKRYTVPGKNAADVYFERRLSSHGSATFPDPASTILDTYEKCSLVGMENLDCPKPQYLGFSWINIELRPGKEIRARMSQAIVQELERVCKLGNAVPHFRVLNMTVTKCLKVIISISGAVKSGQVNCGSLVLMQHVMLLFRRNANKGTGIFYHLQDTDMIRYPSNAEIMKRPGPRILSLDGFGSRCLITLRILSFLEKDLQEVSNIHGLTLGDVFDWIVASDTGSLIAIGLERGMSVQELQGPITTAIRTMYRKNWLKRTWNLDWFGSGGWYNTDAFEDLIRNQFDGNKCFGSVGSSAAGESTKSDSKPDVAIATRNATTKLSELWTARNFPCATVVEAVRAATANPTYFRPYFRHGDEYRQKNDKVFYDPTGLMLQNFVYPADETDVPTVVSVGTGTLNPQQEYHDTGRTFRFMVRVNGNYFRLQPIIPKDWARDESDVEEIISMMKFPEHFSDSFDPIILRDITDALLR